MSVKQLGVLNKLFKSKKPQQRKGVNQLITELDPRSPISEAYRILRTNLGFKNFDQQLKYIAVSSSVPGEGKSTTTANLAMALAQGGKRVILVDADLRKPTQHKIFDLSVFEGLTNALVEDTDPLTLCKEFRGLKIITAGTLPPNPSELLASTRMKRVLERLGEHADYVIMDCPPILALNDTMVLAPYVDGYLLVVGSGRVPKPALRQSKQQLEQVGGKLIGAIVNLVDVKGSSNSYYYYYGEQR